MHKSPFSQLNVKKQASNLSLPCCACKPDWRLSMKQDRKFKSQKKDYRKLLYNTDSVVAQYQEETPGAEMRQLTT